MAGVRAARALKPVRHAEERFAARSESTLVRHVTRRAPTEDTSRIDEDEALARAIALSMDEASAAGHGAAESDDIALAVELSMMSNAAHRPPKPKEPTRDVLSERRNISGAAAGNASSRFNGGRTNDRPALNRGGVSNIPPRFPQPPNRPSQAATRLPRGSSVASPIIGSGHRGQGAAESDNAVEAGVAWSSSRPKLQSCKFCGKEYGSRSLSVHERQCRIQTESQHSAPPNGNDSPRLRNPDFVSSARAPPPARPMLDRSRSAHVVNAERSQVDREAVSSTGASAGLMRRTRSTGAETNGVNRIAGASDRDTLERVLAASRMEAEAELARQTEAAMRRAIASSRMEAQAAGQRAHEDSLRAAVAASRVEAERAAREQEEAAIRGTVALSRAEAEAASMRQEQQLLRGAVAASRAQADRSAQQQDTAAVAAALAASRAEAERAAERRLEEETRRIMEASRREFEAKEQAQRAAAAERARLESEEQRRIVAAQEEEYMASLAADENKDRQRLAAEQQARHAEEAAAAAAHAAHEAASRAEASRLQRLLSALRLAGSIPVEQEPPAGADTCEILLQLPWGQRIRRRFNAAAAPEALAGFLMGYRASDLAAAPPPALAAGDDSETEEQGWARLITCGFALKTFEGTVLECEGLVAQNEPSGGAQGRVDLRMARGGSLRECGLGRMEKLLVEIRDP